MKPIAFLLASIALACTGLAAGQPKITYLLADDLGETKNVAA